MIADGIIMSKFIQLIQLWGGAPEFLLTFLQVLQNRAARMVTKRDWFTSTEVILRQCGWLSIRQLIVYHTTLQVYKIKTTQQPDYFHKKFNGNFKQNTRFAASQSIKENGNVTSDLGQRNFTYRATKLWNRLPTSIRASLTVESFKHNAKTWIKSNVPI